MGFAALNPSYVAKAVFPLGDTRIVEHLNDLLFLAINAPEQASGRIVAAARFGAEWIVPLAAAIVVCLWIWSAPHKRAALLTAVIGVLAGLGSNHIIGLVWVLPRPFLVGIGSTLDSHPPENSFPSDHATFLWSLGLSLVVTAVLRWWGWLFVVLGVSVAWARVYLGLHFPLDMAGSLLVSLAAAALARLGLPQVERRVFPPIEALYEFVLQRVRLPVAIFPRRSRWR